MFDDRPRMLITIQRPWKCPERLETHFIESSSVASWNERLMNVWQLPLARALKCMRKEERNESHRLHVDATKSTSNCSFRTKTAAFYERNTNHARHRDGCLHYRRRLICSWKQCWNRDVGDKRAGVEKKLKSHGSTLKPCWNARWNLDGSRKLCLTLWQRRNCTVAGRRPAIYLFRRTMEMGIVFFERNISLDERGYSSFFLIDLMIL